MRARPYALASDLFNLRGEEARAWAHTVRSKRRFWKGDSHGAASGGQGSASIGGISPTVGEGTYPVHEVQDRHYAALET